MGNYIANGATLCYSAFPVNGCLGRVVHSLPVM